MAALTLGPIDLKFIVVDSTHYISYQSDKIYFIIFIYYIYFRYSFYATDVFCQYAECRCHLDRPMLFCASESFSKLLIYSLIVENLAVSINVKNHLDTSFINFSVS